MNLIEVMSMLGREKSKEMVIDLIQDYGNRCDMILKYAPQFNDDLEVVTSALSFDIRSIYYASERLKNNDELVMYVVRQEGRALQYVGNDARFNRQIVLAAVQQDGMAIQYAVPDLWDDEEIVAQAIQQNPEVLDWIDSVKNEYVIT